MSREVFNGHLLSLVLLGLGIAASASAQTAREYFKELNAANTFNRYKDEYVCFRDDDVPSFAVIARVGDIIDHMKKSGDTAGVKNLEAAKDGLIVETYYKGVSSGTNVFSLAKRDDPSGDGKDYSYEFAGDNPGKMVYSINWVTGRYLQRLYMYQQSKSTAAREGSGKCEPIHPGRPSEIEPLPQPNIKLIYFGFDNHAEKEPDLLQLEKTWGEHPPCSHWRATIKKEEADYEILFGTVTVTITDHRGQVLYKNGTGVLYAPNGNPDGTGVNICKLTGG